MSALNSASAVDAFKELFVTWPNHFNLKYTVHISADERWSSPQGRDSPTLKLLS
jgi:predicted class III extradiol MEMO1 family dioxygenase